MNFFLLLLGFFAGFFIGFLYSTAIGLSIDADENPVDSMHLFELLEHAKEKNIGDDVTNVILNSSNPVKELRDILRNL